MTDFAGAEASHEGSQPIEFYTLSISTGVTYQVASGKRDYADAFNNIWTAIPTARSDIGAATPSDRESVTITLPVNHALVKRWFKMGVPPRQVQVWVYRYQPLAGLVEQLWHGYVNTIDCEKNEARLEVPAYTMEATGRSLPVIADQNCPHILYDGMCQIARASFSLTNVAMHVDGRRVRIDLSSVAANDPYRADFLVNGELYHPRSDERMTIINQIDVSPGFSTVTDIDLQAPISELTTNDVVTVYAGCAKDIITCKNKFNNVVRFGGHPYAPTANPFAPGGSGLKA